MPDSQLLAGITAGELIDQLTVFDRDMELTMGGLQFYRLKDRGMNMLQVEFAQQVYRRSSDGKIVVEELV